MTREETKKIIRIMVDSYPNYKPSDLPETIDVWCEILSEYTYQEVAIGLKAYILSDTSGFAPAIGQIVDKIQKVSQIEELNELEAWDLVRQAIKDSGRDVDEVFAKLPPLVQKAVGKPRQLYEWGLTENLNHEVVGSNFMRVYAQVVKRDKEVRKLPKEIREAIGITVAKCTAIEDKSEPETTTETEGVPMPEEYKRMLEDWKK